MIDGGVAAVGLLAWVVIAKYLDHFPLYRLEQIAARDKAVLARPTLAEWVGRIGVALQPLADRLAWHLLQSNTLHADETPVAQLDPGKGKTQKLTCGLIAAMTWSQSRDRRLRLPNQPKRQSRAAIPWGLARTPTGG